MSKSVSELQARKELLMLKAELERMELKQEIVGAKNVVAHQFGWLPNLRRVLQWGGNRSLGSLGPVGPAASESLNKLFADHPYLGVAASLAFMRLGFPGKQMATRAALAGGALAAAMAWFKVKGR